MTAGKLAAFEDGKFVFSAQGFCCVCEADTEFRAERDNEIAPVWYKSWFRDALICTSCRSLPRERALMSAIQSFYPNWRELRIHESSPVYRAASKKMQDDCPLYTESQYDLEVGFGNYHPQKAYRSENLEQQTFDNESFDLVITQDVFEHLFSPDHAIKEIARTLAPGGAHIMTVPIVNATKPSVRRARLADGVPEHILPPQYHGNPMSKDGSLVTMDWGYDIVDYLSFHSGLLTCLIQTDDLYRGIHAVYTDTLVCKKTVPMSL